jgi:hypothetical protein
MSNRVSQALEDVYRVFAAQSKPREIEACPCCIDRQSLCLLLSTPLREITADQLSAYASSVLLTAGDEADFRYFLPRILEISLRDRHWWPDLEVVLGKLRLAGWNNWSSSEWSVLQSLFDAGFDEAIENAGQSGFRLDVDTWLCGLGLSGTNLQPYLAKLEAPAARRALLEWFERNADSLKTGSLWNSFWQGHDSEVREVVEWVRSPRVQSIQGRDDDTGFR